MEVVLVIGITAITITGFSIEGLLRKIMKQNKEIIKLLNQLQQK